MGNDKKQGSRLIAVALGLVILAAVVLLLLIRSGVVASGGATKASTAASPGATGTAAADDRGEAEKKLANQLSANDTATIQLDNDVNITGILFVNGDKTLTGPGKIVMQGSGEYIIVVNDDASLKLGVVLDGAGNATNGVYVSPKASFAMTSGGISDVPGHGLRVLGQAQLSGGNIASVGTNWIMVDTGAKLSVDGTSFTDAGEIGVLTAEGSEVTLGKGVTMSGSKGNLLYNGGTMEVTGGSYTEAEDYAVHNEGTLSLQKVDFTGAKALGYLENSETGTATITDGSMKNSRADFIYNKGEVTVTGTAFDTCLSTAIDTRGEDSSLTMEDCSFENIGKTVVLNRYGDVTAKNITIGTCGSNALHNRAGVMDLKNITIDDVKGIAFYNDYATDSATSVCKDMKVDGFTVGSCTEYGIRTNGGKTVLSNGTMGLCDNYGLYVRKGEAVTNRVNFLGVTTEGKSVVQIGLSTNPDGSVTMNETDITGGARGITNHGTLTFNSGKIHDNKSSGNTKVGAGVNNSGTMILNGGTIINNSAKSSGGGIYNTGKLTVKSGEVSFNSSATSGGGIASKGTLILKGGQVYGNYALNYGGGIYNSGATYMYYATVMGNKCGKGGGGMENTNYASLSGGLISKNSSAASGGGFYNGGKGEAVLSGVKITGNSSGGSNGGGGVQNMGKLTVKGSTVISGNTAGTVGGGINNTTSTDGTKSGKLFITGGTITGNTAGSHGGGVYNNGKSMSLSGGSITGNDASGNGDGINSKAALTITGGTISGDDYDLYIQAADTKISGSPEMSTLYKTDNGTLTVGGTVGTDITVYLPDYTNGKLVLSGSASLVASENEHFLLPASVGDKSIIDDGTIDGIGNSVASIGSDMYDSLAAAMKDAVQTKGSTITLIADTTLTARLDCPVSGEASGCDVTLDLNNHTISLSGCCIAITRSSSSLTIKGGTLIHESGSNNYITFPNSGTTITLEDGTYTDFATIQAGSSTGNTVVKGGSFTGLESIGPEGKVTIYGGTFNIDPAAFVAPGYEAVANEDGTWTVQEAAEVENVVELDGTGYASLAEALEALGDSESKTGTIKLLKDVTESFNVKAGESLTLDLNGCTLDLNEKCIEVSGAFTLTGSGTVTNGKGSYGGGVYVKTGGSMTMSGGTITGCNGGDRTGGI